MNRSFADPQSMTISLWKCNVVLLLTASQISANYLLSHSDINLMSFIMESHNVNARVFPPEFLSLMGRHLPPLHSTRFLLSIKMTDIIQIYQTVPSTNYSLCAPLSTVFYFFFSQKIPHHFLWFMPITK